MPEEDGSRRYYTPISTAATADFAAVLAQASRVYRPYDADLADSYLAAARKAYDFPEGDTDLIKPDLTDVQHRRLRRRTAATPTTALWAAAEMWETTGEAPFLADFEARDRRRPSRSPTTSTGTTSQNLGVFTYLLSSATGARPDDGRQR